MIRKAPLKMNRCFAAGLALLFSDYFVSSASAQTLPAPNLSLAETSSSDFDWGFKEFANYLNDNSSFNRFQYDPTFLSEVMEKYGHLNGYLDVLRMFPYSLSHYHPDE